MNTNKVTSSLIFKFIERLAVKGIGLIISILLARMLTPEDFGHVAIITVFINLSITLVQGGFSSALLQKKDVTELDYSTVFIISNILALIMMLILWLLAPVIADIYGIGQIILPLRIYSMSLIIGAFSSIQLVRMQKQMKFKEIMICSLCATVLSGVLGVISAYSKMGIWALIIYYFSNVVFNSIFMLISEKWIPQIHFSRSSAKRLFGFGWKMLVSSIICSLYSDIRAILIGKRYSTTELAYYNRGQQFPNIISHTLDNAIQSVMFPTFVLEQDSIEKIRDMLSKSIVFGATLIIPTMVGLAAISNSFVELILSDKWISCVAYMQILCFADANITFTSSNLTVIKALGRSDIYMRLEVIRRISMIIVLAISVFGFNNAKAIAIGYLISAWIDVLIITFAMKKIINFGFMEQIMKCWKAFLASAIMGISVILISKLSMHKLELLVLQIVAGGCIYIFCCILFKSEEIYYLFDLIKGNRRKKHNEYL